MSTLDEIKAAIDKLSLEERADLARRLYGWQDDNWDRQIANDAKSGRLDAVLAEADEEIRAGQLRDLPLS